MRTRIIRWLAPSIALLTAACGDPGEGGFACNPACPARTHCTASGCVGDDIAGSDLAVAPPADLAGQCIPACAAPTPRCNANGQCVPCLEDAHCPAGHYCHVFGDTTVCLPGCSGDARCDSGQKCCAGACTDTAKDPHHCGACGTRCAPPHADGACAGGQCAVGACNPSWDDCNHEVGDGCEVNLRVDVNHCGACGAACALANATSACGRDGCYIAHCDFGWEDCDASDMTGCEASVAADPKNCGSCGLTCAAVPRAQIACSAGACLVQSCSMGFGNCNGVYNDGCEINLLTDRFHCGKCGAACAQGQVCVNAVCDCPVCTFPNAKAICVAKQCAIDSCLAGFANCDGNNVNGCEIPTAANDKNCGGCGVVCPQGLVCRNGGCTCPQCNIPNAVTACVNNQCVLQSCLPGFGDCDRDPINGCEVDLRSDTRNCGACGAACAAPKPYCLGGVCDSVGVSCAGILQSSPNAPSGAYAIDPDGVGGNPFFTVYCDMTADGGGWTLVAKAHRYHTGFTVYDEPDAWFAQQRDIAALGDATSHENRLPGQSSWGQALLAPLVNRSTLTRFVVIAESDFNQRGQWFKALAPDLWLWFGHADHTATKVCLDAAMSRNCVMGKLRGGTERRHLVRRHEPRRLGLPRRWPGAHAPQQRPARRHGQRPLQPHRQQQQQPMERHRHRRPLGQRPGDLDALTEDRQRHAAALFAFRGNHLQFI